MDSALHLAIRQLRAYNQPRDGALSKADDFLQCFSGDVVVCGLDGQQLLAGDGFRTRYRTVFRESAGLQAWVRRRWTVTGSSTSSPSFVLDAEGFRGLVKPIGSALDGSTGLSEETADDILVMYMATEGLIRKAWFARDTEGLAVQSVDSAELLARFLHVARGELDEEVEFHPVEAHFLQPPVRVAVLNCDPHIPGDQDLSVMLRMAASEQGRAVDIQVFKANEMEYPESFASYDGFVISGSPSSVNDSDAWIAELQHQVRVLHDMQCKLVGICFGHQMIVKALGGEVAPNSAGWEVGRCGIALSEDGLEYLSTLGGPLEPEITLQEIHQDVATRLPENLFSLGGSHATAIQGTFNRRNVLTLQGHPEFTTERVLQILDYCEEHEGLTDQKLSRGTIAEIRCGGVHAARGPTHAEAMRRAILNFLTPAQE